VQSVTVEKAAETLPDLLREVSEGTDVVITRDGEPVARLTPLAETKRSRREPRPAYSSPPHEAKRPRRKAGSATGKVTMSEDFEEPLEEFADYM
jgi:prevent-host-death family protein